MYEVLHIYHRYMNKVGVTIGHEHESVKEARRKSVQPPVIDLEDCLRLQTQEEKVSLVVLLMNVVPACFDCIEIRFMS